MVAVGVLCALFAGVFRYADDHFYDKETFLENTAELGSNADIRERLFTGFRTEIIRLADGEPDEQESTGLGGLLEDSPLDATEPITEEQILRDLAIEQVLLDIFDSELYDQVFAEALDATQQQIVRSAELESAALLRDNGEIFFDMRRLYPTVYERLAADPATAPITQNVVPDSYGIFKVADRDTSANFLWTLLRNSPNWRGLATLGAIFSLIGAVVVAERRPSTAIQFGGGLIGVGVVVIVIVYLIRFIVPLLASGGPSPNPVVATYVANTSPLVSVMIRMIVFGVILAVAGGIARWIWPDDWVYSSVSDDRGVRSIKRRRGARDGGDEPQPQPAAAAAPVQYPGYAQPPYPGYPPQQPWGQPPYPGQYPPQGYATYPAGPFAQPAQPLPQHYTSPGKPTVPVMPVQVSDAGDLVPPPAPALDASPGDLPADAAQAVPRVVATTDTTLDASSPASDAAVDQASTDDDSSDDWAGEKDW